MDKFPVIRLQKSNYWGQKFIIINFCEYKALKNEILGWKTVENQRFYG